MAAKSPLMEQYKSIKNEHKDAFLFYRLGDFYELFYSRNLGLQETFFPHIEFDNHSSTAFDNIIITAYDQNAKPHEYTFKFHKENGIQVNYEKYLNEYLHVA